MKKLLIVIDFQNYFINGILNLKKAKKLEDAVYDKIKEYKLKNYQIIFTFDTKNKDCITTSKGENLPVIHCIKDSLDRQLYGKTKELYDKTTMGFNKNSFGSMDLALYLKDKSYDSIELAGVVSNICVLTSAVLVKTVLPKTPIIIDAKCTASCDENLHEKALDILQGLEINIINR